MIYIKKLNLSERCKEELFSVPRKIRSKISELNPKIPTSFYWSVGMGAHQNIISFNNDVMSDQTFLLSEEHGLPALIKFIPEIPDYFKRFGLNQYIGGINEADWGIHRHVYSETSRWNLALLDSERADNSLVSFWEVEGDYPAEPLDGHYFDVFEGKSSKPPLYETTVMSGEVYLVNSWCWHSHVTIDGRGKVQGYLIPIDGSVDEESAVQSIVKIESL